MNNSIILEDDGETRLVATLLPSGDIKLSDEALGATWCETGAHWYSPDSLERALRLARPDIRQPLADQLLDAIRRLGKTEPGRSAEDLLMGAYRAYIDVVRAGRTLADLETRIGKKKENHEYRA